MCAMNPRLLRPLASGFNPKSLGGLSGWWDASDSATLTLNSGNVSEWRDKSGEDHHILQASAAVQPPYESTAFNGKPAVTVEASSNQILRSASGVLADSVVDNVNMKGCLFVVAKSPSATVNSKTLLALGNANDFGFYLRLSDGNAYFDCASGGRVLAAIADTVLTGGGIWYGGRDAANVEMAVNGSVIASRSNATGDITVATAAGFGVSSGNSEISYAEILVFRRALATKERNAVEAYLSKKWGVTLA